MAYKYHTDLEQFFYSPTQLHQLEQHRQSCLVQNFYGLVHPTTQNVSIRCQMKHGHIQQFYPEEKQEN